MAARKGSKKFTGVFPRGKGFAGSVKVKGKTYWTDICRTQKEAADARPLLKAEIEGINVLNSSVAPHTFGAFRDWWLAQERASTKIQRERGTPQNAMKRKTLDSYEEQSA